jgi:hypothetical protein
MAVGEPADHSSPIRTPIDRSGHPLPDPLTYHLIYPTTAVIWRYGVGEWATAAARRGTRRPEW